MFLLNYNGASLLEMDITTVENIGAKIRCLLEIYSNNFLINIVNMLVSLMAFILDIITLGLLSPYVIDNIAVTITVLSLPALIIRGAALIIEAFLLIIDMISRDEKITINKEKMINEYNERKDFLFDLNIFRKLGLKKEQKNILIDNDVRKSMLDETFEYINLNDIRDIGNISISLNGNSLGGNGVRDEIIDFVVSNDSKWIMNGLARMEIIEGVNKACRYLQELLTDFDNEYKQIDRGVTGEKNTIQFLKKENTDWTILENIRIGMNGITAEIDALIISKKGIFAIEVKNYGNDGQELVISTDGSWGIRNIGSSSIFEKENATNQNLRHCRILNDLLIQNIGTNLSEVSSIIAIGNENVKLNNESQEVILNYREIASYINSLKNEILTDKDVKIIKDCVINNQIPLKKFKGRDYLSEIQEYVDDLAYAKNLFNKIDSMYH